MLNILLTRALAQVRPLQSLVSESGCQPILFPTLEIEPLNNTPLNTHYDVLIFISVNAVEYALKAFKTLDYQHSKIFAVGMATAKRLNQHNLEVEAFPSEKASSEALLAMPEMQKLANQNILIFRGEGGRETLKQGLKRRNMVEYIEVYRRIVCNISPLHRQALSQFLQNNQGIIVATSVENLSALLSMVEQIDANMLSLIKNYPLVVLSERIKTSAQSMGFNQIKVAPKTSDIGLLKAIQCSS